MALINCPECQKEVSDKAVSCPNCGIPLTPAKTSEMAQRSYGVDAPAKKKTGIIFILLILIFVALVSIFIYNKSNTLSKDESFAVSCVQSLKDTMKSPDSFMLKSISCSYDGDKAYFKIYYSAQNSYGAQIAGTYYSGFGVFVTSEEEMKKKYDNGSGKTEFNVVKISKQLK